MDGDATAERIAAVRAFNRFWTRAIGALDEGYLRGPYSLTETRVLYELAHRDALTASDLARDLGLDSGYLSRILRGFERRGLIAVEPVPEDRRRRRLGLTGAGRAAFAPLEEASRARTGVLLARASEEDQERLTAAMTTICAVLQRDPATTDSGFRLRAPGPGDLGWVVARHGALYAAEYGWDERFEALVAGIVSGFGAGHDPARERCWIAERHGTNAGSVFLVRQSDEVAKLRLLLVEPWARGAGIGRGLVEACIAFARDAGYRRLTLWTNDVLVAARTIYERAGFRLVAAGPHRSFGHDLVGETWELGL